MDTIFRNSINSKISNPYRLLLNLADKVNLKRSDKYDALSNLSSFYSWKIIKSHISTINAPTWNEEFELLYGSYSISDTQRLI